jgi:hypothetical protein
VSGRPPRPGAGRWRSRGAWLLNATMRFGDVRQAAASCALRGASCSRCLTGHVSVAPFGEGDTTIGIVFRCRCGSERVSFAAPVPDEVAQLVAYARRPFAEAS